MKVIITFEDNKDGNVDVGCKFSEALTKTPAALLAVHIILWAHSVAGKPQEVLMLDLDNKGGADGKYF